ncbi:MAG TPA: hypothetical protein VN026_07130 [Bacteroidia bacterium]|jgi:hypothetical protein|nr:hypothetical protein [Bacteroidia bacterium]
MKKLFIAIVIMAIFVSCKRKQNLRDLGSDQTLVKYPVQCYNAVQDPNESGVDCGGPCGPCNFVTPPCTYTANKVVIGSSTYSSTASSCSVTGSGQFEFSGFYTNGSYVLDLGTSTPDLSKVYSITNSVPGASEATVNFSDGSFGGLILSTGNVYVSQVGGKYHATICGGTAYSFVTSQTYTITGDVSCP